MFLITTYLIVSFCAVGQVSAESVDVSAGVDTEGDRLIVNLKVTHFPAEEVLNAIGRGFRSEIIFAIKVLKPSKRLFSFFGDTLIKEKKQAFTAGWDVFEELYYIEDETGTRRNFSEEENFISSLGQLHDCIIPLGRMMADNLYALISVQVIPVRLSPPLTIINLLKIDNIIESPWIRVEIPGTGFIAS